MDREAILEDLKAWLREQLNMELYSYSHIGFAADVLELIDKLEEEYE